MKKTSCFERYLVPLNVILLLAILPRGAEFSTSPTTSTACNSSTGSIDFKITLNTEEFILGPRIFYFHGVQIAVSNETFITPEPSYVSRLTSYGTYGISLTSVTTADAGEYMCVYFVFPQGNTFTSTATLSVLVAPLAQPSGCSVRATQSSNRVICTVNSVSGNCGIPPINAYWTNFTTSSNQFECLVGGTYQCCATSAALTCYSGSPNDFCILFSCTRTTTRITSSLWSTSSTTTTTKPSSAISTATTNNTSANSTTGSAVNATNSASTSASPTTTESTASTTNNKSTNTTVAGLTGNATIKTSTSTSTSPATTGSSTPMNKSKSNKSMQGDINVIVPAIVVPDGLLLIGAIIFVVILYKRHHRAGKNVHETPVGMAVQDRDSIVDGWNQSLKHVKAADKLNSVYTTLDGFIIYPGPSAMSTVRPHKDKKHYDVGHQYSRPYAGTYGYQAAYIPSTYMSARAYTHKDIKNTIM